MMLNRPTCPPIFDEAGTKSLIAITLLKGKVNMLPRNLCASHALTSTFPLPSTISRRLMLKFIVLPPAPLPIPLNWMGIVVEFPIRPLLGPTLTFVISLIRSPISITFPSPIVLFPSPISKSSPAGFRQIWSGL